MKKLHLIGALALAGLFAGLPAVAQSCPVEYRLWRPNAAEVWYQHGEVLQVEPGEEVHLYIHTPGNASTGSHYTANAEIGYPANFGLRGNAREVRDHLRMTSQNGDDRRSGRLRFVAEQPGQTAIGYRITGVKSPGKLNRIPEACRTGSVAVSVGGVQAAAPAPIIERDPRGRDFDDRRQGPAVELVELLYRSILRRDRLASDPDDFVRQVAQNGERGLADIAGTMTISTEFRNEALRRTGDTRRGGDRGLVTQLLDNIYSDLYGYQTPRREDRQNDLADLDLCLSNDRGAQSACARLGRNLVARDAFYDANRNMLDRLADRQDRRDARRAGAFNQR